MGKAATEPGWWELELRREHLAVFRFLFFGVLAVDAFLQIAHAPRYGAGDFNVPHLAWLPLPVGREAMLAIDLLLTYCLALAALGVGTRIVVPLAAALDAYYYFSSQLDSYQHHYLVVLLLVIACFVPWESKERYVRSWALRLFTLQIAIVYAWAAIAKLDPLWLDGTTLKAQLRPPGFRDLVGDRWALASLSVIVVEVALATLWLRRSWWRYLFVPGVLFHASVELADFRIGQFSYIMIAIYVLALPGGWMRVPAIRWPARPRPAVALAIALAAGAGLLLVQPVPVPWYVAVAIAALAVAAWWRRREPAVAAAHLAACALIAALGVTTDQATDYYRFWAGTARRLGDPAEMEHAYRRLLAIEPDHGPANYHLGRRALERGDAAAALASFERARRAQPDSARAYVGLARAHLALGDRDRARAALEDALQIAPGDAAARALMAQLVRGGTGPDVPDREATDED